MNVKLDQKVPYELDGGDRPPAKRLKILIDPASVTEDMYAAMAEPLRAS